MKPISPATKNPFLARRIPEGRHRWLTVHGPHARIRELPGCPRARHIVKGPNCTKPALRVDAISVAPEASIARTARVPEVGDHGLVGKLANLRGRTVDVCVGARTAVPASGILPVGIATETYLLVAAWLPIVRDGWLNIESAAWGVRLGRALGAGDTRARVVATEPALRMYTICPTAQFPCDTVLVPIVRDEGEVLEVAAAGWAIDDGVIACTAKTALEVLAVRVATQWVRVATNLAIGIPEVAHADGLVLKLARPLRARGQGLATQGDDGGLDTVHLRGASGNKRDQRVRKMAAGAKIA